MLKVLKNMRRWMGKDSALDRKEVSTREGSAQDRKRVKFQSTIKTRLQVQDGKNSVKERKRLT